MTAEPLGREDGFADQLLRHRMLEVELPLLGDARDERDLRVHTLDELEIHTVLRAVVRNLQDIASKEVDVALRRGDGLGRRSVGLEQEGEIAKHVRPRGRLGVGPKDQ